MKVLSVRHVGIVVKDVDKCIDFYQSVFGLKIVSLQDEAGTFLDTILGGKDIKVKTIKMQPEQSETLIELLYFSAPAWLGSQETAVPFYQPGLGHVAFTVQNVEKLCEAIIAAGGTCISKPQLSDNKTVLVAFSRDIEGNLLELVQKV